MFSVFSELVPPLMIDRIFLEQSKKTFTVQLKMLFALLKMYSDKLKAAGSIEGVAFILSSFISLGGRAMSAAVSRSTWVQLHLNLILLDRA